MKTGIKRETAYFKGANGIDDIYTIAYIPSQEIRGYIQFVHDTYEHIDCYQEVMRRFAGFGYLTFGHDHMGHGLSCKQLGVMNGTIMDMLQDTQTAFLHWLKSYPPKELETYQTTMMEKKGLFKKQKTVERVKPPLRVMIGIGFGSTLIRNYAMMFDDVNCVVLCGDKGFSSRYKLLLMECNREIKLQGNDAYSEKLTRKLERPYITEEEAMDRFLWRTSDKKQQQAFKKDKQCHFAYTLSSLKLLMQMETASSLQEWANAYPLYLATYVIAGDKDPYNCRGKDLNKMISYAKMQGMKNFFYKFYDGYHNLFFETNKENVLRDIMTLIRAVRHQQYGDTN